jgi:hypothetical protein
VIWGERKRKYFWKWDWTAQIRLIRFNKSHERAERVSRARRQDFSAPWELWPRLPSCSRGYGKSGKDHRSMKRTQLVSIFSRGWMIGRSAFLTFAVLGLLAAPGRSPAQDAGVSGIPPGPANARGLNGSVSDPAGIGNAAKVPAIPPPAISPVPVPTVSPPAAYRTFPVQRAVKMRRTRLATSRSRPSAARAAVREKDRLLDRKITSICRGC